MSAFTPAGSGGAPAGAGALSPVTTPQVMNPTIGSANTEQSFALPSGCKRLQIQCRTPASLKIAFSAGQSGVTYVTVPSNTTYLEPDLLAAGLVLYYQSPTAGVVVEILTWT